MPEIKEALAWMRRNLDEIRCLIGPTTADYLVELCDTVERWSSGDFTAEEIHEFCHKIAATVPRCEFEAGCRAHTDSLYGPKPEWVRRLPIAPGRYLFTYADNPGPAYEFLVFERDGDLVARRPSGHEILVDLMSLNIEDRWCGPLPDERAVGDKVVWTCNPPAAPGLYLQQRTPMSPPSLYKVIRWHSGELVVAPGFFAVGNIHSAADLWCGPLSRETAESIIKNYPKNLEANGANDEPTG